MAEKLRNTFDWGELEDSAFVIIGKIFADEKLAEMEAEAGHPFPVDLELPIRRIEVEDAA